MITTPTRGDIINTIPLMICNLHFPKHQFQQQNRHITTAVISNQGKWSKYDNTLTKHDTQLKHLNK